MFARACSYVKVASSPYEQRHIPSFVTFAIFHVSFVMRGGRGYQGKVIWMNDELSETESIVCERIVHVCSDDHFIVGETIEGTSNETPHTGPCTIRSNDVSSREFLVTI